MTPLRASNEKKVLVIDDESSIVTYLTAILEDAGYETHSIMDPQKGLATAHEQLPDLITLDIMMPKQSGIALYQEIKLDSMLRDIPVMFVTAFRQTDDLWPAAFRNMVPDGRIPPPEAYLEKPIDVDIFLETVAFLIRCASSETSAKRGEVP